MKNHYSLQKKSGIITLALFGCMLINAAVAQVSFTADVTQGCKPLKVTFTNTSIMSGNVTYVWSWNDGSPNYFGLDTAHTFYYTGNYNVGLFAFDSNTGMFLGSSNMNINVTGGPNKIYSNKDSACVGEDVYFYTNPSYSATWYFGDGTSSGNISYNPSHAYMDTGKYIVKAVMNTPCGLDSLFKVVVVDTNAIPNATYWVNGSWTFCPGDPVSVNANDWNLPYYKWDFGDGDSSNLERPVHTYTNTGDYPVKLTVTNQCGNTNSHTDTIHIKNNIYFPNWAKLNVSSGSGCPGDMFSFWYYPSALTQVWAFGDGDSSWDIQPTHIYQNTGTYTVSVYLKNGCGNDTTLFNTVTIGNNTPWNNNPNIWSNKDKACPGEEIYFETWPQAKAYLWVFGDGDSSTASTPLHAFSNYGNYNVAVTMTNNCGMDTTIYKSIVIDSTLVPYLNAQGNNNNWGTPGDGTACPGDTMIFYSVKGAAYFIDFGDGDTSTVPDQEITVNQGGMPIVLFKHVYTSLGSFNLKFTFYNNCGNSATDSLLVTIGNNQPVSGDIGVLTPGTWFSCETLDFIGVGGTLYNWHFGDGDSAITNAGGTSHAYSAPGNYIMNVDITNSCGNTATVVRSIYINPIPEPNITLSGDTLISSPEAAYQWYLDGTAIAGATGQWYVASQTGLYTLSVTDSNGCSTSSKDTVCYAAVDAGGDLSVCSGGSAVINTTGGNNAIYSWTPSAGLSSTTISNPTATPAATTTYYVTVTEGTCTATDSVKVTVAPSLTSNAGTDKTICAGDSVVLNGSGGGNYSWSTAAGLSSTTVSNPKASPASTTTYYLTVSSGSCSDIDSVKVTVNTAPPTPSITASGPLSFCQGDSVVLSTAASTSYLWNTGETTQSITVKESGNFTVAVQNSNGCSAYSAATTVTVNPLPGASIIANGGTTFCQGDSVTLTANNGTSYVWSSGETTKSIVVKNTGTYSVTVTNAAGCSSSSAGKSVTVNPLPAVTITPGGPTTFCQGGSVVLTASGGASYVWSSGETTQSITVSASGTFTVTATSSAGCVDVSAPVSVTENPLPTPSISLNGNIFYTSLSYTSYQWNLEGNPINGAVSQVYGATVSGNYSVTVTDVNGCTATSPQECFATINAGQDVFICPGGNVQLSALGAGTYTCTWNPATDLSDPNIPNPVATPSATTTYTVSVTVGTCTISDDVTITITNSLTADAGIDTNICLGAGVMLNASGGGNYLWSPAADLSDPTVFNPVASPLTPTVYTVTVFSGSCTSSDSVLVTVNPLPQAAFGATAACIGDATSFSDSSATSSGSIVSWMWDFGDGSGTSALANPSYTYGGAGSYNATLVVNNSFGCADTVTGPVTVNSLPAKPVITLSGNTLTSSAATGNQWNISSSPINGEVNQTYQVVANGSYTVTVTDNNGCSATSDPMVVSNIGIAVYNSPLASLAVYPNPYSDAVNIVYSLVKESQVRIEIYNMLGEKVVSIANEKQSKGSHGFTFNPGEPGLSDGIYFLKMVTDEKVYSVRLAQVK